MEKDKGSNNSQELGPNNLLKLLLADRLELMRGDLLLFHTLKSSVNTFNCPHC
jgi:hypothetical protein